MTAAECSARLIKEQERQDTGYFYKDGYLEKGTMEWSLKDRNNCLPVGVRDFLYVFKVGRVMENEES